jgi:hypothetical protein
MELVHSMVPEEIAAYQHVLRQPNVRQGAAMKQQGAEVGLLE